ncbi:MAG: endolytic transglycosylase MltG [Paludibacteraceae bacterium]|nr:endolytic transglycosylase MltG [Paludibacteraceae bacterium]
MAKSKKKWILGGLTAVTLVGLGVAYYAYSSLFAANVQLKNAQPELYIKHGDTFDDVVASLEKTGAIKDMDKFISTAKMKKYDQHVKSGCYIMKNGMSSFELVRLLASGNQTPVKLTFNNKRTAPELAGRLAEVLEMDSLTALEAIYNDTLLDKWGIDRANAISVFVPNTYEIYWDITPAKLMARMKKEYDNFWNSNRKAKLARTGLSQKEVSILASIVEEEQNQKYDEQPAIAGLYINRLRKGMKLESDPTVKFAVGDFTIRRVLTAHLSTDSPYNTYMYAGLPPGPIRIPSIKAIDNVLNFKESDYIYMCAKEDFSGYHNFAVTGAEHQANAQRYHSALNRQRIYK